MGRASSQTCLITGCGGFIGSHLAELMLARGWQVWGTVHRQAENLRHFAQQIRTVEIELSDRAALHRVVAEARPDAVFHLASQGYIGPSWEDPVGTFTANVLGTLYLFEAMHASASEAVAVLVSSSAAYGGASGAGMIPETQPFGPGSPYAVSKIAQEMLGDMYWRSRNLKVIRARPFALIGPRKTRDAVSDFARGIVRIEQHEAEALPVGDLAMIRDFVDVRDGANALRLLAERGAPGEAYNVCAGIGTSLQEILTELIALSGRPVRVVVDAGRIRQADDAALIGDPSKLQRLGWQPQIPLRQTLAETLAFWRTHAAADRVLV
ncbi:MAG: GDP-mannose 4,6-dehydratase [Candidatus Omnitrophica bacterium]|nr:GDP-mannose 4,6-dehydratase [Candidatus Omnitrophota bacterium]